MASDATAATVRKLNPRTLIVTAVTALVVLAGAVAAYAVLGMNKKPPAVAPPIVEETPTPSPSSSLNPTDHVAVLKAIEGYKGSGEATRSVKPGRFVLTVSVTLPDPGTGKFYEVYLVRSNPAGSFSAGKLTKQGSKWVMTLDQIRDASVYREVFVTLETKDDKQMETRVLTGSF